MNVDKLLDIAIKSIRKAMPEAIYEGLLINRKQAFDASTNCNREVDSDVTTAEIIFDSFKAEEILGTTVKSTDVKLHIIADKIKSIDFYTLVRVKGRDYRIKRTIETVIGSKAALFTIVAEL